VLKWHHDLGALLGGQSLVELANEGFRRLGGAGWLGSWLPRLGLQNLRNDFKTRQRNRRAADRHEEIAATHAVGGVALGALSSFLFGHAISPVI
jgi:hypothetical protein